MEVAKCTIYLYLLAKMDDSQPRSRDHVCKWQMDFGSKEPSEFVILLVLHVGCMFDCN